ncbi:MAG: PLP-dependent transferase, partial [Oscillospiraceae bacterium]|nr:PLP-dependent transferase [Oscillospiraceae bacterium]
GIVVDSGKFNFKNNKRFPLYNEPDPSYHGLIYADLGETAFITRLRTLIMRDIGGCMSAFNAFEIMNGIETLSIRMERHCENALKVAKFLDSSDKISAVHFPMLKNSPDYELAKKYLPKGAGSVYTFDIRGNKAAAAKFIDSLKLIIHCANVGDTRSLISHPATTTHSQLNEEQLNKAGISSGTVRISVGIENVNDIIDDIKQALDKI